MPPKKTTIDYYTVDGIDYFKFKVNNKKSRGYMTFKDIRVDLKKNPVAFLKTLALNVLNIPKFNRSVKKAEIVKACESRIKFKKSGVNNSRKVARKVVRKSRKSRKSRKVARKSRKSRKARKSRKSRKVARKARKSRKSRNARKARKSRKVARKSRKVARKSRKVARKSRKVARKSRKVARKARKSRKSRKARKVSSRK